MDFFQAQENARRRTGLLVFYFAAAVVMIVVVLYLATLLGLSMAGEGTPVEIVWWRPDLLAVVLPVTLAIVAGGSLFKMGLLRGGGPAVARSLGGQPVDPATPDPHLRRLLNVVEEMAIASGVRVPAVFVLPEEGINAFAAGWTADDAAVAVTTGALQRLSRDELQGVIAHEFSHILNGDMRLNVRLIGLLFGILLLAILGRVLVQSLRFARGGGRKNAGGVIAAVFIAGLALIIVGYIGVLFGRLIQAAVSRQREFLADAASVQFTRNPDGIVGALKKIGGHPMGSRVRNVHSTETGHLFFVNALQGSAFNLFSTHPPLQERIRAIDPHFDGRLPADESAPETATAGAQEKIAASIRERIAATRAGRRGDGAVIPPPPARPGAAAPGRPPPLHPAEFVAAVAALDQVSPEVGAEVIAAIPGPLREAAHDPALAPAVVFALLGAGSTESGVRAVLSEPDRSAYERLAGPIAALPPHARLPLLDLTLPTLKVLPEIEVANFLRRLEAIIAADHQTSLFEFAVRQVTSRHLGATLPGGAGRGEVIVSFAALAGEIGVLLGAIARVSAPSGQAAEAAFRAGAARMPWLAERLVLPGPESLDNDQMIRALDRLGHAAPPIKKQLLHALATAAAADGTIQPAEAETMRMVAAALDLPAPPLPRVADR